MTKKKESHSPDLSGLSYSQELIAAVASGVSGAIGVIRISGAGALENLKKILPQRRNSSYEARKAYFLKLVHPQTKEVMDEVVLTFFQGPHSYTGEDTVELSCHGGPYILDQIMASLNSIGIRQAEPGEFTKRAFLNGKLDLTNAEGIRELVQAQTKGEWLSARQLVSGKLAGLIEGVRKELVQAMAYVEAQIDFPDEDDVANVNLAEAKSQVDKVREKLLQLVDRYDSGQVVAQGLRIAIVGPPNAGKSTLMNELLDKERAIVTHIAGTTRDYLEERCLIKGRLIRLVDTAGIRQTEDVVESLGVASAKKLMEEADLCLFLLPCYLNEKESADILQFDEDFPRSRYLVVATKVDLHEDKKISFACDLQISCASGKGMEELQARIVEIVDRHHSRVSDQPYITNARQQQLVLQALEGIEKFNDQLNAGMYEECLAFELQEAAHALERIIGKLDNEDVLDSVFSEFCIGK